LGRLLRLKLLLLPEPLQLLLERELPLLLLLLLELELLLLLQQEELLLPRAVTVLLGDAAIAAPGRRLEAGARPDTLKDDRETIRCAPDRVLRVRVLSDVVLQKVAYRCRKLDRLRVAARDEPVAHEGKIDQLRQQLPVPPKAHQVRDGLRGLLGPLDLVAQRTH
jgi:hypothetical protein